MAELQFETPPRATPMYVNGESSKQNPQETLHVLPSELTTNIQKQELGSVQQFLSQNEPSTESLLRIDSISKLPIVLTNLAYTYLLPQKSISRRLTQITRSRFESMLELEYAGNTDLGYELCGSRIESLAVPHFYPKPMGGNLNIILAQVEIADIDMMNVLKQKKALLVGEMPENKTGCYAIRSEETHVGYLRLQIMLPENTHPSYRTQLGDIWYLSSEKLKSILESDVRQRQTDKTGLDIHIQGPSIQVLELEKMQRGTVDTDNVFSIPCPKWPTIANDFQLRPRASGWPDPNLINSITVDGCLIVPMSHPHSLRPDLDWRYSFSVAERRLAETLSDVQRQSYILLKIFRKACLTDFKDILQSYHLKTVFLWECEKQNSSMWVDENLSLCFWHLLEQLRIALSNRELLHYFIPINNLFDRITETDAKALTELIEDTRIHPIKFISEFSSQFKFIHIPNMVHMGDLLSPIINMRSNENMYITLNDIRNCMCSVHYNFGNAFMIETNAALSVESYIKGISCLLGRKDDAVILEQMINLSNICIKRVKEDITVCKFIEQVITDVPGAETSAHLLDLLGCAYHACMLTTDDNVQREQYKSQALNTFNKMKLINNTASGAVLDFVNFLYGSGEYDKVIELLNDIDMENMQTSYNIFYTWEKSCIDQCFREEIDKDGSVQVLSYALAVYLLVCSYLVQNMIEESKSYIYDFETFVKGYSPNEKKLLFPVYTLLGLSYRKINQFESARQWFKKALNIVPENRTVRDELSHLRRGSFFDTILFQNTRICNISRNFHILARALVTLHDVFIRWRL